MNKLVSFFLIAVSLSFSVCSSEKMVSKAINRQVGQLASKDYLSDPGKIVVVTVGTGTPIPGERAQSGTAVFVNGRFFMFDVGSGVVQKSENFQLPLSELDGIFITHYHSDHVMGLPNMVSRSWMRGRTDELTVYGPQGLDTIMESVEQFLSIDNQYRVDHHGPEIMDLSKAPATVREFEITENAVLEIYQEDGISIKAFDVNHEPIEPAVGYVIEYDGKKVVISGDTKKNDLVLKMSKDCDLLVHEAMLMSVQQMIAEASQEAGQERNAQIIIDIQDYHSSPAAAAEIAQKANVKKLVLNHLAPAPDNRVLKNMYLDEMKAYKGPKHLANDGDVFIVE